MNISCSLHSIDQQIITDDSVSFIMFISGYVGVYTWYMVQVHHNKMCILLYNSSDMRAHTHTRWTLHEWRVPVMSMGMHFMNGVCQLCQWGCTSWMACASYVNGDDRCCGTSLNMHRKHWINYPMLSQYCFTVYDAWPTINPHSGKR